MRLGESEDHVVPGVKLSSGSPRESRPVDRLLRPFQLFAHDKVAGAFVLMGAMGLALAWANSPWRDIYDGVLSTHAHVGLGGFQIDKPIALWINDGLMGIFFFVVGLEIKRELRAGELASIRKAALPVAGAVGGMVVPAAIYAGINLGGPGAHGWGIPMATDIAFALGVLLLFGPRTPLGLKVFLTALAIVDDIGAIAVIAVFYTEQIAITGLAVGLLLIGVSMLANVAGVRSALFYFMIGTLVWVSFLKSGVHATLASVLMAMTIPARTRTEAEPAIARLQHAVARLRSAPSRTGGLLSGQQQHAIHGIQREASDATAPLQELEHALMPVVTFVVMPLFALANAGVDLGGNLGDAVFHPVCLGVVAGLFVGKQAGILCFAALAVRLGIADLPAGVTWRQLHAVSVLGGIGFTMSLFVGGLAFTDPEMHAAAKIGILSASLLSAVVGAWLFVRATRLAPA